MSRRIILLTLLLIPALAVPAAAATAPGFHYGALAGLVFFNLLAGTVLLVLLSGLAVALFDRMKRLIRPAGSRRLVIRSKRTPVGAVPVPATVGSSSRLRRQETRS